MTLPRHSHCHWSLSHVPLLPADQLESYESRDSTNLFLGKLACLVQHLLSSERNPSRLGSRRSHAVSIAGALRASPSSWSLGHLHCGRPRVAWPPFCTSTLKPIPSLLATHVTSSPRRPTLSCCPFDCPHAVAAAPTPKQRSKPLTAPRSSIHKPRSRLASLAPQASRAAST